MATITMPIDPMTEKATSRSSFFAPKTPIIPIASESSAAGNSQLVCRPAVTSRSGEKMDVYTRMIA